MRSACSALDRAADPRKGVKPLEPDLPYVTTQREREQRAKKLLGKDQADVRVRFEGLGREEPFEPLPPERSRVGEVKNPNYWRRDAEREAMARKHERRPARTSGGVRA
jgi:hypothetical protein